jgi:hypothetical protein
MKRPSDMLAGAAATTILILWDGEATCDKARGSVISPLFAVAIFKCAQRTDEHGWQARLA